MKWVGAYARGGATQAPAIADFRRRYPQGAQVKLYSMNNRPIKKLRFIPILKTRIYVASIRIGIRYYSRISVTGRAAISANLSRLASSSFTRSMT